MAPPKKKHLRSVIPILPVADLDESITYWRDRLGFALTHRMNEPREFAWVHRDNITIELVPNAPSVAAQPRELLFGVLNVRESFAAHESAQADIISPLTPLPGGGNGGQYVVRELNGHRLYFRGLQPPPSVSDVPPPTVRLIRRPPTPAEYVAMTDAVGWKVFTEAAATYVLTTACFTLVAEETDAGVIGILVVLPKGPTEYFLRDLAVHPDWQGRRIGTAMLQDMDAWLIDNAAPGAMIRFNTDEATAPFYESLDYRSAFSMYKYIPQKPKLTNG